MDSLTRDEHAKLTAVIRTMFAEAGRDETEARWFMDDLCAPLHPRWESARHLGTVANDKPRIEFAYAGRILDSARRYLSLSHSDRELLRAGVEDGVRWRGEPIPVFLDVVNETLQMREMGFSKYQNHVRGLLENAGVVV